MLSPSRDIMRIWGAKLICLDKWIAKHYIDEATGFRDFCQTYVPSLIDQWLGTHTEPTAKQIETLNKVWKFYEDDLDDPDDYEEFLTDGRLVSCPLSMR